MLIKKYVLGESQTNDHCYDNVTNKAPKTNNAIEAWHRSFESLTCAVHENLWRVIENLQRQQVLMEMELEKSIAGEQPPRKKQKYLDTAERLLRIVENFDEESTDTLEYLRGIAHNIGF